MDSSTATSLRRSYRVGEDVLFQKLDKDAVLLNLKTEQYYSLDGVGTRIWHLLAETRDLDATLQKLLAEYAVDEATLRADVLELTGKLAARGLLVEEAARPHDTAA